MDESFDFKKYFETRLGRPVHSYYVKKDALFGPSYFINDAYVLKKYDEPLNKELSLERLDSVHEIIKNDKTSEKVLYIDRNNLVKITKLVHGDLSYEDEPSISQVRNVAKALKKLHKHVSEYDVPLDIVSLFYKYKDLSEEHLDKIYENRIVREFNNIKDKIPIGLCHNNLNKDNIIYRFDSVFLINYELANINYTYFDLASYIHENKLSQKNKEEFLKTYFGAKYNSLKEKRVEILIRFLEGFMYYYQQYLLNRK